MFEQLALQAAEYTTILLVSMLVTTVFAGAFLAKKWRLP
jgi:hypothetical protein